MPINIDDFARLSSAEREAQLRACAPTDAALSALLRRCCVHERLAAAAQAEVADALLAYAHAQALCVDVEQRAQLPHGQTLLLARRLVEMEIPVIQANMGHVQMWDTHVNHFPRLRTMLPALDNGLSALLDDLKDRGLLETTLVVCVGEFGRTPTISPLPKQKVPGRHHWAAVYSALFAGGGTLPGQIIGASDNIGGHPITTPYHPNDMGATIYDALGIDPTTIVHDRLDRPVHLNTGHVMDVLYSGVA